MQPSRKIKVCCPSCCKNFKYDISSISPRHALDIKLKCPNKHWFEVTVLNYEIIGYTLFFHETDIDNYIDVPSHIKETLKQAHSCFGEVLDAPEGGACLVRKVLDEFLLKLGFTQDYVGTKVSQLEIECNQGNHPTLKNRLESFRTIAGMGGFHAHAQQTYTPIVKSEWEGHLSTIEGAVKEKWNRRIT